MENTLTQEIIISPEVIHSEKTLYLSSEGKYVSLPRVLINIEDIKIACFQQPDGMVVINVFQDGKKSLYDSKKDYELKNGQKLNLQKIIEEGYSQKYSSKINSNRIAVAEQFENTRRDVEKTYISPETGGDFRDLPGIIQCLDPASYAQNLKYEVEITAETPPSFKSDILNYKRTKLIAEEVLKKRIAGRPLTKNQIEKLKLLVLEDLAKENANIKFILQSKARESMDKISDSFLNNKDDNWNPVEIMVEDQSELQVEPDIYKPMIFEPFDGVYNGMTEPTTGVLEKKPSFSGIVDNEPKIKNKSNGFDKLRQEAIKFAKTKIGLASGALAIGTAALLTLKPGQMAEVAHNPATPEIGVQKTEVVIIQKQLGSALPPPLKPVATVETRSSKFESVENSKEGFGPIDQSEITTSLEGISGVTILNYSEKDMTTIAREVSTTGKINLEVITELFRRKSVDPDFYRQFKFHTEIMKTPLKELIQVKKDGSNIELIIKLPKPKTAPKIQK
jgi:hypothetical protein